LINYSIIGTDLLPTSNASFRGWWAGWTPEWWAELVPNKFWYFMQNYQYLSLNLHCLFFLLCHWVLTKLCVTIAENITEIYMYTFLQGSQYVLEYLFRFLARLQPLCRENLHNLMKRLVASLTQQGVPIHGILRPSGTHYQGHIIGYVILFLISRKCFILIYFYVVPSQILLSSDTVFAMLRYLVALYLKISWHKQRVWRNLWHLWVSAVNGRNSDASAGHLSKFNV